MKRFLECYMNVICNVSMPDINIVLMSFRISYSFWYFVNVVSVSGTFFYVWTIGHIKFSSPDCHPFPYYIVLYLLGGLREKISFFKLIVWPKLYKNFLADDIYWAQGSYVYLDVRLLFFWRGGGLSIDQQAREKASNEDTDAEFLFALLKPEGANGRSGEIGIY